MTEPLVEACAMGEQVLTDLMGTVTEEDSRFESKGLSPAFLASSKCLIFLESSRGGIFFGGVRGEGFAIARTSAGSWSAPCFVSLRKFEIGAFFGFQSSKTLMSALTKSAIQRLIDNEYTEFGSDVTVQLWPTGANGPDDQVAVNSSDWVTATCSTGVVFDFSLSGGSIKINEAKNTEVYGEGVTASQLLNGQVDKPKAMIPLYQKVSAISKDALK